MSRRVILAACSSSLIVFALLAAVAVFLIMRSGAGSGGGSGGTGGTGGTSGSGGKPPQPKPLTGALADLKAAVIAPDKAMMEKVLKAKRITTVTVADLGAVVKTLTLAQSNKAIGIILGLRNEYGQFKNVGEGLPSSSPLRAPAEKVWATLMKYKKPNTPGPPATILKFNDTDNPAAVCDFYPKVNGACPSGQFDVGDTSGALFGTTHTMGPGGKPSKSMQCAKTKECADRIADIKTQRETGVWVDQQTNAKCQFFKKKQDGRCRMGMYEVAPGKYAQTAGNAVLFTGFTNDVRPDMQCVPSLACQARVDGLETWSSTTDPAIGNFDVTTKRCTKGGCVEQKYPSYGRLSIVGKVISASPVSPYQDCIQKCDYNSACDYVEMHDKTCVMKESLIPDECGFNATGLAAPTARCADGYKDGMRLWRKEGSRLADPKLAMTTLDAYVAATKCNTSCTIKNIIGFVAKFLSGIAPPGFGAGMSAGVKIAVALIDLASIGLIAPQIILGKQAGNREKARQETLAKGGVFHNLPDWITEWFSCNDRQKGFGMGEQLCTPKSPDWAYPVGP